MDPVKSIDLNETNLDEDNGLQIGYDVSTMQLKNLLSIVLKYIMRSYSIYILST